MSSAGLQRGWNARKQTAMDGADLWGEICATDEQLRKALKESRKRGMEWAQKQAAYYTIKAKAAFKLKADGESASFIAQVLKGMPDVNAAMLERDAAEVSYENAREARNVYKKEIDTMREQLAREWAQAKEE